MMYGRARWQEAEATRKDFNTVLDPSGQGILYIRALQGHSGRNPIDPTLQDNVFIPNNFFEYTYQIGCAVSLHSITNSGLIAGGQISSKERQTVFFTAVNPMNKDHRDPQELDLTKLRLASYKQKWKVRGDPYVDKSPQRKPRNVLCLITRMPSTQQELGDPYVDQNPQSVAC